VIKTVLFLIHVLSHYSMFIYTPYPGSDAPGRWRPTPPQVRSLLTSVNRVHNSFSSCLLKSRKYATQRPWCLTSDSEFRPPPPPDLQNATYIFDHNQIAQLGALNSSMRTNEQTDIARFWYDGPNTVSSFWFRFNILLDFNYRNMA
jgi:hypothetical protein